MIGMGRVTEKHHFNLEVQPYGKLIIYTTIPMLLGMN